MSYRIFISHKNDKHSNDIGTDLGEFLEERNHTVFFDKKYLKGGMTWQQEIINELLSSDVVIVILNEGTAESDWVQREIDMARAHRISILPLTIAKESETIQDALDRFDLNATQFMELGGIGRRVGETYKKIEARIKPLSQETLSKQKVLFNDWDKRRNPPKKITKKKPSRRRNSEAVLFTHPDADGLTFTITTGDASLMHDFDILVNTENNYMQMARFYQIGTVSYSVRKNGAHMSGEWLFEDTIQNQLYDNAHKHKIPVPARTVLATSAGHPESDMKQNTDYRYILHAAAVRFVSNKNRPNQPVDNIPKLIGNCFRVIAEIDENKGEVRGKETIIVPANYDYLSLNSILFTVFGAGEGGKTYKEASEDIISSFAGDVAVYIQDLRLNINKIGFSVYFEEDVEEIENLFLIHGFEKVEN